MGNLQQVLSKGNRIGDTKYNISCSIDLRIVDLGTAFTKSLKNGMMIPEHVLSSLVHHMEIEHIKY